ncbi:MAG: IS21 family transposase, partial [Pseudomonadota bacterium]
MAYRELHVVEIKEVLRLWSRGHGFRTVARRTGVDRKTARRYVEAAQKAGLGLGAEVSDDARIADVAEAVRPGSPAERGKTREPLRAPAAAIQT